MNVNLPPLEIKKLSYGARDPVFHDISFAVGSGEYVTVLGKERSARTAFIECLVGNLKPTSGTITFWGTENRGFNRETLIQKIGWVFQQKESFAPWVRLGDFLRASSRLHETWDAELAQRLTRHLSLDSNRRMSILSADEKMKFRLIRALAFRPPLVVFDEMPAIVSPEVQALVLDCLLEEFESREMAVLSICHSSHQVMSFSNRVIELDSHSDATPSLEL